MTALLITGGAGFVASNLALFLAERHPDWDILAADNLHRRGSELNLPDLEEAGVRFADADVRDRAALAALGRVDAIVDCAAEPSALAGVDGDAPYVVETNLLGTHNCLELARRHGAALIFLSTSRVYPYPRLGQLGLVEAETRFELAPEQPLPGASAAGVSEGFPLDGPRTLYGATKLAAELLIAEYAASFGIDAVVDRCGVIAGPRQVGREEQGVFALWLLHHHFGRQLRYIGYGGSGKQVRDLVHIADLCELVEAQLLDPGAWAGFVGNVGGGREHSLSLLEATALCRELTGNEVPIAASERARPGDVPVYFADCSRLFARTAWRPARDPRRTLEDLHRWVIANERALDAALAP